MTYETTYKTLEEAVKAGAEQDFMKLLVNMGDPNAKVDIGDGKFVTPLHIFASMGRRPVVDILFDLGADPNATDSEGETALKLCIIENQPQMVELLLDKGASINVRFRNGDTPLHVALVEENDEIAKLLIERGADTETANDSGISPRQIAYYLQLRKQMSSPETE